MAVMTDTDLEGILCKDAEWQRNQYTLHIYPYEPESLTPVGYDLRVGKKYSTNSRPGPSELSEGQSIAVGPGETVLVTTLEDVGMPKNKELSALICSKVSVVSKGLSHVSTTIDPDWEGPLLIALNNPGRTTVRLQYGHPFATVVFLKNHTSATRGVNRPPGRPDILLNQWSEFARRAARRDLLLFMLQPTVVLGAFGLGLWVFGSAPGSSAAVAVGVALSQIIGRFRTKGV